MGPWWTGGSWGGTVHGMGIRGRWRAGHMKDPMAGVFRVAGSYDPHPSSSGHRQRLTGVLVVPGLPPTPAEVDGDTGGRWVGQTELPVTVDRADPTNIRVEWQDVRKFDQQAVARQRAADEAAKLAAGPPAGFPATGPGWTGAGPGWSGSTSSTTTFTAGGDTGIDVNGAIGEALRRVGMDPSRMHVTGSPNVEVTVVNGSTGAELGPGGMNELFDRVFGSAGNQGGAGAPAGGLFGGAGLLPTEDATAVVVAAHEVAPGVEPRGPGSSLVELTLDVTRAGAPTYSATTRIGFSTPQRRAAVATVGTRLPVKVSPANPALLTVDVSKLNLP
jgi:hypothetical protein